MINFYVIEHESLREATKADQTKNKAKYSSKLGSTGFIGFKARLLLNLPMVLGTVSHH